MKTMNRRTVLRGIGGIAVGFAAKDLLSNFFGGLGIYLDRPFTVGDWIRSPDNLIGQRPGPGPVHSHFSKLRVTTGHAAPTR